MKTLRLSPEPFRQNLTRASRAAEQFSARHRKVKPLAAVASIAWIPALALWLLAVAVEY